MGRACERSLLVSAQKGVDRPNRSVWVTVTHSCPISFHLSPPPGGLRGIQLRGTVYGSSEFSPIPPPLSATGTITAVVLSGHGRDSEEVPTEVQESQGGDGPMGRASVSAAVSVQECFVDHREASGGCSSSLPLLNSEFD